MAFVDDVLADFNGDLRYSDILQMSYKEIGYLREHRKKYHPKEMDAVTKALLGVGAPKKKPKTPGGGTVRNPYLTAGNPNKRKYVPQRTSSRSSRSHR